MFTFLPAAECDRLCAPGTNPNAAKERLAWEVTALIHGKDEADRALSGAKAAFGGGDDRSSMPAKALPAALFEEGMNIVDLFTEAGLCATKSEARRLVQQGGAAVSGPDGSLSAVTDVKAMIDAGRFKDDELILRAGKKHFCRIVYKQYKQ
jgi:tyrosyl-tRNA synthetase